MRGRTAAAQKVGVGGQLRGKEGGGVEVGQDIGCVNDMALRRCSTKGCTQMAPAKSIPAKRLTRCVSVCYMHLVDVQHRFLRFVLTPPTPQKKRVGV